MSHHAERLLVTGGASCIGRAIAEAGLERGWDVVVLDRDATLFGHSIQVDLADSERTAAALDEALQDGPITRLVNNVGAVFPALLEEQTLLQVDASYVLNLRSAVQCTQAVLPGMKTAGFGRIVNMSSRAALGKELRTAYAAAKSGLIGVTRVWALELGRHGITVNAIGPGPSRPISSCVPTLTTRREPRRSRHRYRWGASVNRQRSLMPLHFSSERPPVSLPGKHYTCAVGSLWV